MGTNYENWVTLMLLSSETKKLTQGGKLTGPWTTLWSDQYQSAVTYLVLL